MQVRGEAAVEPSPGDVVHAPDGEEHRHGATPDDFMAHLSITEGSPHWGDHVPEAEHADGPPKEDRAMPGTAGRSRAGGAGADVTFARAGDAAQVGIEPARHAKYDRSGSQIVGSVVGGHAHAVTVRLVPVGRQD